MGKRKIFHKTDLTIPAIEHTCDPTGVVKITPEVMPPVNTVVYFPLNPSGRRSFDFAPWYGVGIDPIVYACQRQIERFLAKQDADYTVATIVGYARRDVRNFLDYLLLYRTALGRPLTVADLDRTLIDGFLGFLRDKGVGTAAQRVIYSGTKSILSVLDRRGIIALASTGDNATFPANPFPNSVQLSKARGERPLARKERQAFTAAVKTAVMPLFNAEVELTGDLIAWALLVVALHTGRNTTPLIELSRDCVRPHPRDQTWFLTIFKRRGHSTHKVVLRGELARDRTIEALPTVRPTVLRLIRRIIELTEPLRADAPLGLKDRLWLYRSRGAPSSGKVTAMTENMLWPAIQKLVSDYGLTDRSGKPLRINVSRLRKTFVNRINEILDGDIPTTAIAAGNTPGVTDRDYLEPSEDARTNFRFMGEILVEELLSSTLGATERTPVGRCSDTRNGVYAPKRDGAVCFRFFDCLRCRNYVVTGDDLYRLFSFYWRVYEERSRMSVRKWEKRFAHIVRLIDRDVIARGVEKNVFRQAEVTEAKEHARRDPHA
jgi:hypothetical protein